ncbi:hypothetical protein [Roseomonas mucosa]
MDGSIKPGSRSAEEIAEAARANLAERTDELRRAMAEFGVRPGHPESVLLHAMTNSQLAFGDMAAEMALLVAKTQEGGKAFLEGQTQVLREATRLANATTAQAQAAAVANDVERNRVIERMVQEVAPGIVDSLRGSLVIKEVAYDRRRRAGFYARGALVFVGVFLAGYLISFWQDSAALGVTVQRCQERMVTAQNGEMWCKMDGHLARGLPPVPAPARPATPAR